MFQVSISVLPGGLVQSYGFFGELSAVVVEDNQSSGIVDKIKSKLNISTKPEIKNKVKRIHFLWLLILIVSISICYLTHLLNFLNFKTPVIMKVRMNN